MKQTLKLSIDEQGIARLVFDLPESKVNKLSHDVLEDLEEIIDQLSKNPNVRALVISSGKPNVFIAGADIEGFSFISDYAEAKAFSEQGQRIFMLLEELSFPTIAVIDGACLGGGLELALACDYRVVSDHKKTILGVPEVSLGLIPGWGGTQRLPDLVGLRRALSMILSGKPVHAKRAWKMKLADAIFAHEFLGEKVEEFIAFCLSNRGRRKIEQRRHSQGILNFIIEKFPPATAFLFSQTKKKILKKTEGHYPAPLVALKVLKETHNSSLAVGLKKEAEGIASCFDTRACKNLVSLFLTSQALKKETGIVEKTAHKKVRSVGILGAGVMGGGIAWLFSKKEIPVRLKDVCWDAIAKGFAATRKIYDYLLKKKKLKQHEVNLRMHKITGAVDYSGFGGLDLIVEAIVEDLEVKKKVFQELEQHIPDDTVICSNTSALSITEMATGFKHPERFVGMHFFNPVNRMPLVEVVPGEKTSPETITTIVALTKQLGKVAVVVQDCPGFLVNRILMPYLNEVGWMLEEGVDFTCIDHALTDFGMPMGPCLLLDQVGVDVAYKVAQEVEAGYGSRMRVPKIFGRLYEQKLFGKKSGKGFYIHKGKRNKPNPAVYKLCKTSKRTEIADDKIVDRTILAMVNEAAKCLEEKVIEQPKFLDLAMIMGIGFPAFRGGVLRYADNRGIAKIVEKLQALEDTYGDRYEVSQLLINMKNEGNTFYA